ncbi:MAG: CRISPR-associated helicase Cas3' [Burkholderiales bacterium]|nr:CRISPR-associated helicase Cas3' [Burkholderiales bacterium]
MPVLQPAIAHIRAVSETVWAEHDLEAHLEAVSALASEFASRFGSGDWARVAGLWHDLGKYRPAFQRYIRTVSGSQTDAHIETTPGRVDHSTAGALHAIERFGTDPRGRILAYLIAGHHAGLPDWHSDETGGAALTARLAAQNRHLFEEVRAQSLPSGLLDVRLPATPPLGGRAGFALWVRMLFSCLVDADFLDTEAFMSSERAAARRGFPEIGRLRDQLEAHMQVLEATAPPTSVNRVRADVLQRCRARAADAPGVFSLTVPTGGGKTLASLAFALHHAALHGKRRIVYAIPYTSIIEQTADVFREIFGDDAIVEHHSAAEVDESREDHRTRLACENWDAPIVVTTNVQLFESLFSARTSRTRKLHSIVDGVVILDETQLLPPDFLQPLLDAINGLARHYGVTFVLSTATQPALASTRWFGGGIRGLDGVRELIEAPAVLYAQLRRVDVNMPEDLTKRVSWPEIANALGRHESVLCIVNSRRECRELHRLMPAGTIHLSALMCGQHRAEVIARLKQMLRRGEPVRVVSTQLVEAGVDVDFPVVYRALAGLDAIAQAAGRCNREGRLSRGQMVVFVPPAPSPAGILRKAEQTAVGILAGGGVDPLSHDAFPRYFAGLYARIEPDKHGIVDLLTAGAGEAEVAFRTASSRFRLIDDREQQPVFVRYGEGGRWLDVLRATGPERWLMRKLQRYCVSIRSQELHALLRSGDVTELSPGIFAQTSGALYDSAVGLLTSMPDPPAGSLVL